MASHTVRPSLAQWWQDRKRKWPWVVAILVLLLFVIVGIFGGEDKAPGGSPEDPPAAVIPDGLPGTDAASARERLEDLGFQVTMESVDGRTVIVESNWRVVSAHLQEGASSTVVLRVEKPAEPTTVPPTTTVEAPPVTETPPAEVAPPPPPPPPPAPEPEPAPEPAPDAYYANCAEAKAAGAAPLTAGEPGYRPALDRDKDGVACE